MQMNQRRHTRFIVSLSAGTGSDGRELWKLNNNGFLPMKIFNIPCKTHTNNHLHSFIQQHRQWNTYVHGTGNC